MWRSWTSPEAQSRRTLRARSSSRPSRTLRCHSYAIALVTARRGTDGRAAATGGSDLLVFSKARRPSRLVTSSGATVNVVRFAKLLASLNARRIRVDQTEQGGIEVTYDAEHELGPSDRSLLLAALRSSLGPEADVTIYRGDANAKPATDASVHRSKVGLDEPEGPAPEEVARWLRRELKDQTTLEAAVITGSFLDPEAAGAFSDIDVALLVHGEVIDAAWIPLVGRLRRTLPKVRVNVLSIDGITDRSPLVACRLVCEHYSVLGRPIDELVPWPSSDELCRAAAFWSDDAVAAIWTRLTDPQTSGSDPRHEAWFASKYALDGLEILVSRSRVTRDGRLPRVEAGS